MDVHYLYKFSSADQTGSSSQAELLCRSADIFTPVSTKPINGLGRDIEIDGSWYPDELTEFVKDKSPDLLFIHTLTDSVLEGIEEIVEEVPVVFRLATNPWEFWMRHGYDKKAPVLFDFLRKVDAIVTPSEQMAKTLRHLGFLNAVPIPTAVDFEEWDREKVSDPELVTVSRITAVKNHLSTMMVSASLSQEFPRFHHTVAGRGERLETIGHVAEVLGGRSIEIAGFVPAQSLLPARAFLQTSFAENGSLSALEACASGTPVVTTRTQGHPFGSHHPEDIIEMVEECRQLFTDDRYYEERRGECLEFAEGRDVSRVVPKYEQLFEKVIDGTGHFRSGGAVPDE